MIRRYKPRSYWVKRLCREGSAYVGRRGRQSPNLVHEQMKAFWAELEPLMPKDCPELLDFGCGVGRLAPYIAPRVGRYVGVDIVKEALQLAPSIDNGVYVHLNEDRIPFDDDTFSVVTAVTVIQHIVDNAEYELWCGELGRVIKPGGKFLIIDNHKQRGLLAKLSARHVRNREPEQIAHALGATIDSERVFTADKRDFLCCFSATPRSDG